MLLHSSRSHGNIGAYPSIRTERTRKIAYTLKWGRMHNAIFWSDLRLAQNSGLDSWQTINNAITLYDYLPANCLVKVVKRNVDDTEAEILFAKGEPEQREVPRIVHKKKTADVKAGGKNVPQEAVDKNQNRQARISHLVNEFMNSSKKKELIEELFPEEGKTFYADL